MSPGAGERQRAEPPPRAGIGIRTDSTGRREMMAEKNKPVHITTDEGLRIKVRCEEPSWGAVWRMVVRRIKQLWRSV